MALEIERRFLVPPESLPILRPYLQDGFRIRQKYFLKVPAIRVRIIEYEVPTSFLTVKFSEGLVRHEFEYEIPIEEAELMMKIGKDFPEIVKTRYRISVFHRQTWEVDLFEGPLKGLVIAEIELGSTDDKIELPEWVGEEITENPHYSNASLALGVEKTSAL